MAKVDKAILDHLVKYRKSFKSKGFIIDLMTSSSRIVIDNYELADDTYLKTKHKNFFNLSPGRLFTLQDNPSKTYYTITETQDRNQYKIELTNIPVTKDFEPLCDIHDTFMLTSDMIDNHTGKPIETTIGKYYINSYLLESVFGKMFDYNNQKFDFTNYERIIAELVITKEITQRQLYDYIDRLTFLDSLALIFMPNMTEELLTIDPSIKKLINDLLREHKDNLSDPNTMLLIEKTIIDADKKLFDNNEASDYMSSKNFKVHRKRMFHGFGILEGFGDTETTINFLKSNLDSGWNKDEIKLLFNDIRKGSASRALETANGGVLAKALFRVFQSLMIIEDDCKSKLGISNIVLNEDNYENYIFRYYLNKNTPTLITRKNVKSLFNKKITIRSPMYCKSTGTNYCYTCLGYHYKRLGVKLLVSEPPKVGSTFLNASMKKMHGVASSNVVIDLDDYTT